MDTFDVVVIGAGSTGEVLAGRAAGHGLSVAIVESDLVGGECSYYACIPSKAMLRPPHVLTEAALGRGSREAVDGTLAVGRGIDAPRQVRVGLEGRRSAAVADASTASIWSVDAARLSGTGGDGRDRGRSADAGAAAAPVAVCTGSTASVPDIPGLRAAEPWTNREALSAHAVPESLVVIGGGAVGSELATAWKSLGADVTMLIREERPLAKMETFAGDAVLGALRELGIWVVTETNWSRSAGGRTAPSTSRPTADRSCTRDEVLVATGREPRHRDIGLDVVGIDPGDLARRRRPPPGTRSRRRLVVRGGRREPPRAPHPHGQVPGAHMWRRDRGRRRRRGLAPRRSPTRSRRPGWCSPIPRWRASG